jgi:hypothetical protein
VRALGVRRRTLRDDGREDERQEEKRVHRG